MTSRSGDTIPARIYPWWLLLVGFVFGVLLTFFVMSGRTPTVTVYRDRMMPEDLMRQATMMVQQATLTAQGFVMMPDPLIATATALAAQANQPILQPPAAPVDPVFATATAFIAQATAMAVQAAQ